ncbi:von Willebrand factor [Stieleria maiorica]|uniref:von Willebrand factor n=1 Tax=Stieleria maiorica TaxID=2795974 RepID=A0A5B9MN46_9BACT|nr:VWA domain-containing protein [Stieleria maiorica]QEG00976.1 von Willebrand factor [Stieleria maiorica]
MSDSNRPNDASGQPSLWDDARITAYVMGELSPQDAAAFTEEMAANEDLRAAVDQAGRVTAELQTLFAEEPSGTLDGDRREQILAASASSSPTGEQLAAGRAIQLPLSDDSRSPKRLVPWLLAAAAAVLLVVAIVPAFKQAELAQRLAEPTASEPTASEPQPSEDSPVRKGDASDDDSQLNAIAAASDGIQEVAEMQRQLGRVKRQLTESDSIAQEADRGEMMTETAPTMDALSVAPGRDAPESFSVAPKSRSAGVKAARDESVRITESLREAESLRGSDPAADPHPFAAPAPAAPAPTIAPRPAPAGITATGQSAPATEPVGAELTTPILSKPVLTQSVRSRRLPSQVKAQMAPADSPASGAVPADAFGVNLAEEAESEGRVSRRRQQPFGDVTLKQTESKLAGLPSPLGLHRLSPTDGDRFDPIVENEFKQVRQHPLSTFSIDVDTASYSKVRRSLVEGRLPRRDAVRIEELVNYFDYRYEVPGIESEHPFATNVTIAGCPWNNDHRLARVAIQGKTIDRDSRPPCNLVFLLDTSGSMNQPNKLPLVIEGMKMLTKQLGKEDRVAIVVYAGSAGMVLDSTPAGKKKKINKALSQLSAGGSTNGGAGIQLAYATARDHFIKNGVNRVILCTDGDFNVGLSGTDELVRLIQEEASDGIFLTALGFGMGNHNDAMMEQISGKGNGNYAFIDTANEAHKVLVRQTDATLVTIAKDVKLQLEFNPRVVSKYRLIGYENRVMAKEDFNDDKKDAGEIGAGHQVTAFYELVMAGDEDHADEAASDDGRRQVDPLKYQRSPELTEAAASDDVLTLKLRYKQPDGDTSTLIQQSVKDSEQAFAKTDSDFRFAAAVAAFGMQLRESEFAGDWTLRNVLEVASANVGPDEFQLRSEFVDLISTALRLKGQ